MSFVGNAIFVYEISNYLLFTPELRQIIGGRTVGAGWNAASQGPRAGQPTAGVQPLHPASQPMQEMPVTPGWSNHVTKQGKEVQRSLYSSITPHELMGATGEADRLTWPEVAHYLMQTTTELADLLGISRSRGTHKG